MYLKNGLAEKEEGKKRKGKKRKGKRQEGRKKKEKNLEYNGKGKKMRRNTF